ncbi:EAL domain-containing protein [Novosphingobium sp. JCM 18896]|uniref:EAL domain-containing protein n=1 Tax=Novosphingobium sp. JCM 18896 TaxID=2989731 RepID=UPI0022218710|nr:EAL domain-containing protein [Novosphingobium sp. JCM 18896]MCW1430812.1 EAL domain-containing protein [Novosphingobium sp. JCM 18896]
MGIPLLRPCAILAIAVFDNFAAIGCVYGRAAAETMRRELTERAREFVGEAGAAYWVEARLIVEMSRGESPRGGGEVAAARLASRLVRALTGEGFEVGEAKVFAMVTIVAAPIDAGGPGGASRATAVDELVRRLVAAAPRLSCTAPDALSRGRYRTQMDWAALAADCIRENGLVLTWRPVGGLDGGILYREAEVGLVDARGAQWPAADLRAALEETGLVRAIDTHAFGLTLDRLHAEPDAILGCNISAASAIVDGWWAPQFDRLVRDRDVASRMIVEIDETVAFSSISLAVEFVDRLRGAGCRIAIDHFGVGHASLRHVLALAPDIIKIDPLYLRLAATRPQGQGAAFAPLVGLARSIARHVVVEGVDDAAALAIAQASGADWLQGHHFGMPAPRLSRAAAMAGLGDTIVRSSTVRRSALSGRLQVFACLFVGAVLAVGMIWGAPLP